MNRRAYTLVELVLATAVIGIVLLGAQSAVLLASRAIPDPRGGPAAVVAASGALGGLADDLAVATAVSVMTPTDILFTVPDRTGDGNADTIRFSWTGTKGQPLLRTLNGGTPEPVADDVQSFVLTYETAEDALPTTYSHGPEVVLFENNPATGLASGYIQSNKWWAQYFKPSLASSARSWMVTRVAFVAMRRSGSTGRANVQLRLDAAGSPGAHVLRSELVLESSLSGSFQTKEVSGGSVAGLTPGVGLWLVFQWVADTEAFEIRYATSASADPVPPLATSADNGGSWTTISKSTLAFTVYGKVCSADSVQTQTVLTGIRARLRTGETDSTGLNVSVRTLTRPAVP
jgi:prepilin-type N-terminal cleavage/methylation domain-containing protein